MTEELQTTGEKALSSFDPAEVKQSQEIAGQGGGTFIPFIPIVEINNRTEKKMAMIDGTETEVEVPAKQGFNISKRNAETKEYTNDFHKGNLNGTILKERFQIEKTYKPGDTGVQYRSDEFDGWDGLIKLYDRSDRKNVIMEAPYAEIRDAYTSEVKDSQGNLRKEKDYGLYVILYINYEMSGDVVRVKIKMTTDNLWFEYKNSFADSDPWAGFVTHFKLKEKINGDIRYWHVEFEKGETINLSEQLQIQKEINKYFMVADVVRTGKVMPAKEFEEPTIEVDEDAGVQEKIEQIPF